MIHFKIPFQLLLLVFSVEVTQTGKSGSLQEIVNWKPEDSVKWRGLKNPSFCMLEDFQEGRVSVQRKLLISQP